MKTAFWKTDSGLRRRRSQGISDNSFIHGYDPQDGKNRLLRLADTTAADLGVKKIKFHHARFTSCGKQFDLMRREDGDLLIGDEQTAINCRACRKAITRSEERLEGEEK